MPIGKRSGDYSRYVNLRSILGILLIALAVMLVVLAARLSVKTETYYVALKDITPGQIVTKAELQEIQANLGNSGQRYLTPARWRSDCAAVQSIRAGELIALSQLSTDAPQFKRMVIELAAPLPSGVSKGDYVEIWQLPDERYALGFQEESPGEEAQLISERAVLVAEKKAPNTVGATAKIPVEVLIPSAQLNELLVAVGIKAPIIAIPVNS